MATATVTYNFAAGTPIVADEVDINFTDLTTFLNTNTVHADGSIAMTGILTLPASDPTTANQAARKSYVDAGDATVAASVAAKVAKAGDTMTGHLTLAADPTLDNHAARAAYVNAGDAATLASAVAADAVVSAAFAAADVARVTAPALATNPKIVGASSVGVTDGSGQFAIATGLAGSIVSATVSNGDFSAGSALGTAILVEVVWSSTTAGSLVVQCIRNDNSAAVVGGTSVRVNWIALGT